MKTSDFDYYLPENLIAQNPAQSRDGSRLMVLPKDGGESEHKLFQQIVEYVRPGDVLVINNTKVIPARLWGVKEGMEKKVEVLLLTRLDEHVWEVLVRPGRRVPPGTMLSFAPGFTGTVEAVLADGLRRINFQYDGNFEVLLDQHGLLPLPPYIKKYPRDPGRYQTVYAQHAGSVAAPTAGLHFSEDLLLKLANSGVTVAPVLLHVGLGTFRPVQATDITQHQMHAEYYAITDHTSRVINETRLQGGRVIAVGTTTARCLESAVNANGHVQPGSGWTDIFIYPGYRFQMVDGMVTNFHLPRSTLLMMISALVGRQRLLAAYQEAVALDYRFFSFGDAMLII